MSWFDTPSNVQLHHNDTTELTKPVGHGNGCWRGILKSAASSARNSGGKKGSAGRSAGSSAALLCNAVNGTASSTPPGTPLVPGTGPGTARSTFQEFLSSTRFCGQLPRKTEHKLGKIKARWNKDTRSEPSMVQPTLPLGGLQTCSPQHHVPELSIARPVQPQE